MIAILGLAGFGYSAYYFFLKDYLKDRSKSRRADTTESSDAPDLSGAVKLYVNDYLKYNVSGYNNGGVMTSSIDYDIIIKGNSSLEDVTAGELQTLISGEWNKTSLISNGDELVFTWNEGSGLGEFEREHNVDLVYEPVKYTVEGLPEANKIDLFDYVNVTFEGNNGSGTAKVTVSDSIPVSGLSFELSQSDGLANDQTVIVTAKGSGGDVNEILATAGFACDSISKTYIVSGLKFEGSWKAEYIDIATSFYNKHGKKASNFALAYITDDDIPELLVWYNKKDPNNKKRATSYFDIYSVVNGSVKKIAYIEFEYEYPANSKTVCDGNLFYLPYSNAVLLGRNHKYDPSKLIDAYWVVEDNGSKLVSYMFVHSSYDLTKYDSESAARSAGAVIDGFNENDYTYSYKIESNGSYTPLNDSEIAMYKELNSKKFNTSFDALNLDELKSQLS